VRLLGLRADGSAVGLRNWAQSFLGGKAKQNRSKYATLSEEKSRKWLFYISRKLKNHL